MNDESDVISKRCPKEDSMATVLKDHVVIPSSREDVSFQDVSMFFEADCRCLENEPVAIGESMGTSDRKNEIIEYDHDEGAEESVSAPDEKTSGEDYGCETMEGSQESQLSICSTSYSELEEKYMELGSRFAELQDKVNNNLSEQSESISSLKNELSTRSGSGEFKQLRQDFDVFAKRLRRVVKAEDSISAETLDAAKVPPDVLEITYAKTLNDLYNAMLNIFGDRESSEIVEKNRDKVRNFSAGVDFFSFENGVFHVKGLSEAISSKLVSVKQIHATYVELFNLLSQHVPNYSSQDFRSFVETGSREYTVEKVVSHEQSIDSMLSEIDNATDELSNLTENVKFMAELQNAQLDDIKSNSANIEELNNQIKDIVKAVNLHTKALKKLNSTLSSVQSSGSMDGLATAQVANVDMSGIEEALNSKADREELADVSDSIAAFRHELQGSLISMQEQQQMMVSVEVFNGIQAELTQLREQVEQLKHPGSEDVAAEIAVEVFEFVDNPDPEIPSGDGYEQLIIEELAGLGPITLKQLENQMNSKGCMLDLNELSSIVEKMEQAQFLTSLKKGRYTYFSLKELVNV